MILRADLKLSIKCFIIIRCSLNFVHSIMLSKLSGAMGMHLADSCGSYCLRIGNQSMERIVANRHLADIIFLFCEAT